MATSTGTLYSVSIADSEFNDKYVWDTVHPKSKMDIAIDEAVALWERNRHG